MGALTVLDSHVHKSRLASLWRVVVGATSGLVMRLYSVMSTVGIWASSPSVCMRYPADAGVMLRDSMSATIATRVAHMVHLESDWDDDI